MKEWDAQAYHRLSAPQTEWGEVVLSKIVLRGDETALDAGCGTGKLTARLAERLPRGHVIALDQSSQMLAAARETLARFGDRVSFLEANLAEIDLKDAADLIFSTATFHWVTDHPRLFRNLHRALRPGGRLIAQCGGAGNIRALMEVVHSVLPGHDPWEYADAQITASRLADAGFTDVETEVIDAPVPFADEATLRTFLEKVILRQHVEGLPEGRRAPFLDEVAARMPRPLVVDYRRLNLAGQKRS